VRPQRDDLPRLALSALRLVGGGAFLLPRVGTRQLGLENSPRSSYVMRLFAARNLAMASGLLLSRGRDRRLWLGTGIACDVLDAGAGLLSLREGKERNAALVDTGASLFATGLGVAGLIAENGRGGSR
jgi:hypothetical protein